MLRQPMALLAGTGKRLTAMAASPLAQRRKLFLILFLWTCLCVLAYRSPLFTPAVTVAEPSQVNVIQKTPSKLKARAAVSVAPMELAVPAGAIAGANQSTNSEKQTLIAPASEHEKFAERTLPIVVPSPTQQLQHPTTTLSDKRHKSITNKPLNEKQKQRPVAGSSCHYDYPSLFDLQFNNIHWQKMTTKGKSSSEQGGNNSSTLSSTPQRATYYLYNAYYDDRWRGGMPSVRVLAMIDRVKPPPTNCLLWSSKLTKSPSSNKLVPIVTRATFVYAWYPKWGNYKDGILQPWIVTCPLTQAHLGLVPDSVSLVGVPDQVESATTTVSDNDDDMLEIPFKRKKRQIDEPAEQASVALPPSYSSSSSSLHIFGDVSSSTVSLGSKEHSSKPMHTKEYDCKSILPITNNLPVYNRRPEVKEKFAVCVKGLDFPHEDVSIRLVEWIELLNLLGASKIFLYNLDIHENITKVLHYYQQRGMVELSPLTLPGDQPNLPEYQHSFLKNKLTAKRQNELIPYNDCLYRNLYSYEYLALLDIDEIIMPIGRHQNWFDLMQQVEALSLSEQNYSRASYNVRNVYFFDDLSGPLGTTSTSTSSDGPNEINDNVGNSDDQMPDSEDQDSRQALNQNNNSKPQRESLERGIPHYLHMMSHVYRSKNYTEPGQYVKCFHNTERVVSLHNHFPMNCFGQCTTYSIPVDLAHLQHYRKDCVGPLRQSCKNDFRVFTMRDTTIWKYKQRMIRRTTRVLNHLGLLAGSKSSIE